MWFPHESSRACEGCHVGKGGRTLAAWSTIAGRPGISFAALDHAQGVAALAARLTAQLVHQLPHQENAPAAGAQLGWVEMGHRRQVERPALVEELDLEPFGAEMALDLKLGLGVAFVGMANDVVDRLVSGQNDGVSGGFVEVVRLADRLDEGP